MDNTPTPGNYRSLLFDAISYKTVLESWLSLLGSALRSRQFVLHNPRGSVCI